MNFKRLAGPGGSKVLLALAVAAFTLSSISESSASFLYWRKVAVRSSSLADCRSFANDAMRNSGFSQIRVSGDEVAGTSGTTYAAITCVATNPAIAIIMTSGDDGPETQAMALKLGQAIAGITRID